MLSHENVSMTYEFPTLADYGWNSFFAGQLAEGEQETVIPAKVIEVHRGQIRVVGVGTDRQLAPFKAVLAEGEDQTISTVGDWLLLDANTNQPVRMLRRKSLIERRAPGSDRKMQLIAANIDTLFIVTSCNKDFNAARLERYLVLASDAGVEPVLVLTKADLVDSPSKYAAEAAALLPGLLVEMLDARVEDSAARLADWCGPGQTVALVGSSGVGKSTLANSLMGNAKIKTQGIREDDAKGRHTTTGRTFYRLPAGGWLLDTPGIRGLEVTEAAAGLEDVFADITELAATCKFSDCAHETEPGCKVQAAIQGGTLESERFKRWQKLAAEEAVSTQTIAQRHSKDRAFGKQIKASLKHKKRYRGE